MKLATSKYGDVIYGKVIKTKPGSGNAASKLTIVTLAKVNHDGKETGKQIKVLCWNSEKNEWAKLSDKARRLVPGQIITARVEFDIGDPDKATAFELKKTGIYKLITKNEEEQVVVCGKVAKTISSNNFFGAYVPVDRFVNKERQTQWFLVSFFGERAKKQEMYLGKGDSLYVTGTTKEVELGDKIFIQLIPSFVKSISSF